MKIKKIKQENTDLISENQNLKTTLEETLPIYETLKSKLGDKFEEWKTNLFKSVKTKIGYK